ncbi:MAG: hypothetical protein HFJ42_00275 [Clostridia bacterium]|nr:hypothetical protein [Clostridia bacterium]
MKIVVVNYANEKYKKTQEYCTLTAINKGKVDKVYSYSDKDIDSTFYNENKKILCEKRGNGLWLWKPYFIKKTLEKIEYGDILFYIDSGAYFTDKIDKILKVVPNFEIICCNIPLIEKQFTKKKVFESMKCNGEKYENTNQIIGTYFIIKKTKFVEKIIDEWLELCCNNELITPSNNEEEIKEFISHREDQSIFSLLCKKYNIEPYNDISQRFYFPKSYKYDKRFIYKVPIHKNNKLPVIIYLHKMSNISKASLLKHKIRMIMSIFN